MVGMEPSKRDSLMNELDLFVAALAITDPAERAAFLKRECQGNTALKERIQQLLAAHAGAGGFWSRQPVPEMVGAHSSRIACRQRKIMAIRLPASAPSSAGKYKLIEEIGEGGMGSVFVAQQTEPVKRAVAVKVIKAGMDSRAVLARFEAERQALAMMDHPNIARVLDAGTTDGGRPFFVMELVKGTPITQYCDEHKLSPRQRLELFVPVCQAIQHAHQKGIIHRDIKPSNVLVALYDDRPVPKVIDFGVAKAAGQPLTDKTLMTGFGAVVGTWLARQSPFHLRPEHVALVPHFPIERVAAGVAVGCEPDTEVVLGVARPVEPLGRPCGNAWPRRVTSNRDRLAPAAAPRPAGWWPGATPGTTTAAASPGWVCRRAGVPAPRDASPDGRCPRPAAPRCRGRRASSPSAGWWKPVRAMTSGSACKALRPLTTGPWCGVREATGCGRGRTGRRSGPWPSAAS